MQNDEITNRPNQDVLERAAESFLRKSFLQRVLAAN